MKSNSNRLEQIERLSNEAQEILSTVLSEDNLISFSDIPAESLPPGKKSYQGVSTADYRTRTQYPSRMADCRPETLLFEQFCAHGTKFDSILSGLLCTNKQLVPGLKLRKLIGRGSDTGESQGTTPYNQKWLSAVSISGTLTLPFAYAATIFKAKKDIMFPRIPIVVLGDSPKTEGHIGEVACKRVNIRIITTFNLADKAVVLGVLRKLEIYDIRVCSLKDLVALEHAGAEEKLPALKELYENSEFASEAMSEIDYAHIATELDQTGASSIGLEEKNTFASSLAAILSTNEEEREIGLGNTERQTIVDLVKGVLGMPFMQDDERSTHNQPSGPSTL